MLLSLLRMLMFLLTPGTRAIFLSSPEEESKTWVIKGLSSLMVWDEDEPTKIYAVPLLSLKSMYLIYKLFHLAYKRNIKVTYG